MTRRSAAPTSASSAYARGLPAGGREDAGELEARQSWTVNGARVAVAGPWVVLALLATRLETAQAYNSLQGWSSSVGARCAPLSHIS
ncbi:hypothetical protein NKG05_24035 [Oerskovia sp. M15]